MRTKKFTYQKNQYHKSNLPFPDPSPKISTNRIKPPFFNPHLTNSTYPYHPTHTSPIQKTSHKFPFPNPYTTSFKPPLYNLSPLPKTSKNPQTTFFYRKENKKMSKNARENFFKKIKISIKISPKIQIYFLFHPYPLTK